MKKEAPSPEPDQAEMSARWWEARLACSFDDIEILNFKVILLLTEQWKEKSSWVKFNSEAVTHETHSVDGPELL